jgi:probable rRNA maturation factor
MNKKTRRLVILKERAPWKKIRGLDARLQAAAEAALAVLPLSHQVLARRGEATVLLTSDHALARLNHDYRGLNKPTNVLSFPQFSPRDLRRAARQQGPLALGDIALAYQVVAKEAREESKNLLDHAAHLVIHGVLHLVGYDHGTEGQAVRMERLERKAMAALGLPDPYAPRPKLVRKKANRNSLKRAKTKP